MAITATEILSGEHRVIERVLCCLEAMVRDARSAGRLEAAPAKDAIDFFRGFADRCHHGKEEAHLFPAIEAKGFRREGGPTGVMLDEHEQGRASLRGMDETLAAATAGDAAALDRFIRHAVAYVGMLREHIYKEDHILFHLANHTLSEADHQAVAAAFARVEAEELHSGAQESLLQTADELCRRYGVTDPAPYTPGAHFHCGHAH
jgi:hemerythrin-like domain-containing protein